MMKKLLTLTLLLSVTATGFSTQKKGKLPKLAAKSSIVTDYIDSNFDTYNKLQKEIWDYSEVGFQEEKSSKALKDHLRQNGFTLTEGIAGEPTAFIAEYGSGRPIIGLTAEFDALPGLSQDTVPYRKERYENKPGHGCGHNLFGTAAAAAGIAIAKWLKETGTQGTIRVYGSPAEEGGSGKTYIVRDGFYKDVDLVLDWHPAGQNAVNTTPGLAKVGIDYIFHGKSAHAAGQPWAGRSALDGLLLFCHAVDMMREHIKPHNRLHYVIHNGGEAPNVVPDYARAEFYARSPNTKELRQIVEWYDSAAVGAAKATQTTVEKRFIGGQYEYFINGTIARQLQKNLEYVGGVKWNERERAFAEALNKVNGNPDSLLNTVERVKPLGEIKRQSDGGGSTDVADISWNVPTAGFGTVTTVPGNPGHSWQNAATVGTTIGTKGLINAAKVIALTGIDFFASPKLVKEAQEEFKRERPADFKYEHLGGDVPPALDYRKGLN